MRQVVRGKERRTRLKFIGKIDKQDPGWQGSNAKEQDEARKTTNYGKVQGKEQDKVGKNQSSLVKARARRQVLRSKG